MVPPALDQTQQEELKGAVEQSPAAAGIQLANWYWRVVRQFVSERFGISLCRSSCLNWLYRLGFACKRPKKRLLKANESKRAAFVAEYAALWEEAQRTEASIFFADEAHFDRSEHHLDTGDGRDYSVAPCRPGCRCGTWPTGHNRERIAQLSISTVMDPATEEPAIYCWKCRLLVVNRLVSRRRPPMPPRTLRPFQRDSERDRAALDEGGFTTIWH